jgi:hypothetical protein
LKIFALILGLEFLIPKSSLLCAKKKSEGRKEVFRRTKNVQGNVNLEK